MLAVPRTTDFPITSHRNGDNYSVFRLSVCLYVCPKLLSGFGLNFTQGRKSIPDTALHILVAIAPGVPPGEPKIYNGKDIVLILR